MYCDYCKNKPATVHLTKIINGQKTELHLCEDCAKQSGEINWFNTFSLNDFFQPFSVNDLLSGFLEGVGQSNAEANYAAIKCERCGMTYEQFKRTGMLGCSQCYKAFADELIPLIKRIHGNVKHVGKVPRKAGGELRVRREIERLKEELDKAVKDEAFEKAAELRDKIKELEASLKETGK